MVSRKRKRPSRYNTNVDTNCVNDVDVSKAFPVHEVLHLLPNTNEFDQQMYPTRVNFGINMFYKSVRMMSEPLNKLLDDKRQKQLRQSLDQFHKSLKLLKFPEEGISNPFAIDLSILNDEIDVIEVVKEIESTSFDDLKLCNSV